VSRFFFSPRRLSPHGRSKVLFVVYPDEGHGFVRPENNVDFAGRAEEFLHEAIGGRSEPWQKVPGATGELK